jgi:hypothetical protein
VAAVQTFYRVAPLGSNVIGNNTSNPFRMGPFHDYRPAEFEALARPDETDIAGALRDVGISHVFVVVTESGINEATLRDGSAEGWERRLDDRLRELGAEVRFRDHRAALYELEIDGVQPVAPAPKPERSLASASVRSLLGNPALAAASAIVLLLLLVGAQHAAGRRARAGELEAAFALATMALVGTLVARFIALT